MGPADDVARKGVITLPTPASPYFVKVIEFAWGRGCTSAVLIEAETPFKETVADGASERSDATRLGASRPLPH
jgi:hypothetical protein